MRDSTIEKTLSYISIIPKSQYAIARDSGLSNTTVSQALSLLEAQGLIEREELYNEKQRTTVVGWKKVKGVE